MKILKMMFMLAMLSCVAFSAVAQDAAPIGESVSNIEILQLAQTVKIDLWAAEAKKSTFANYGTPKKYIRGNGEFSGGYQDMGGSPDPLERRWTELHPSESAGNSRPFSKGWSIERLQARQYLLRPCKDNQRKILENFIAAADALEAKDAKKFKDIIVPLADDLRTLL